MINSFKGKYAFLSNMYPAEVHIWGHTFPSSENAYQSAKGCDQEIKVFLTCSPQESKKYWKGAPIRNPSFMSSRVDIMTEVVRAKFTQNKELAQMLMDTGDAHLVEGNRWNDSFWGVTDDGWGVGSNHLGKILMQVRQELLDEQR